MKDFTKLMGIWFLVLGLAACEQLSSIDPIILSFDASSDSIDAGENVTLSWNIVGGAQDLPVSLTPGDNEVEKVGSLDVSPTETTVYTLSAGAQDEATKSLTVTVTNSEPGCDAQTVEIPDPVLKDSLTQELGKDTFSCDDLAAVSELELGFDPLANPDIPTIEDLSGLEYAVNLKSLTLYQTATDLDLTPLVSLTKLESLILGFERANDLSPLTELANLKTFNAIAVLPDNADFSSLAGSSLETIEIRGFNDGFPVTTVDVEDFTALPNLQSFKLDDVFLENEEALANLTSLLMLNLDVVRAEDDAPLSNTISALSNLTNLQSFGYSDDRYFAQETPELVDFAPLGNFSQLTDLRINAFNTFEIESIAFISRLSSLTTLNLRGNDLEDISALLDLPWSGTDDTVDLAGNDIPQEQIEALKQKVENVITEF